MKVVIPSPLLSYTKVRDVEADGATLAELLADLDRRFPGIRFRMIDEQDRLRQHMRIFVNGEQARDLATPLAPGDEIQIIQALSGG
ncbi:MAG TPA: MoaD/ThiS family protein [bacterium]|nr:MoaD/ThiS family protein [bacterium]